jgi:hypothetical protein
VTDRVELTVDRTWDGEPLPLAERATLRLRLDATTLVVELSAPFHGDPPPDAPVGPTARLWEHEVVELFVAAAEPAGDGVDSADEPRGAEPGNREPRCREPRSGEPRSGEPRSGGPRSGEPRCREPRYTEIELGPWGHHLVIRLAGIRRAVESGLPLDYHCRRDATRWAPTARLPRALLPAAPWSAAAFAIHGSGSERRYLTSVALPGEVPDFHQPARFPPLRLAERPPHT